MQKQISFLITAAVLMAAFVGAALYTFEVAHAQAPAGGNMSKGGNMTAGGNMTNATSGAKPNATD